METGTLRIPDYVVSREVGEETVLLNLESGNYFGLNPMGARIWKGLVEGRTGAEIESSILGEFDVTPEVVARDYADLTASLLAAGLLER
jgi:hypothetical protein